MSEQTTQANGAPPVAELTVQDLNALKAIIDVASTRGTFKPNEMVTVGSVYGKLDAFLNAVAAQQAAQQSEAAEEPAEADAPAETAGE
jgi:hypothetical protein